jgi:hypothetical protein
MKYQTIKRIDGKKNSRIITKRNLDYDIDSELVKLTNNYHRRNNQHRSDYPRTNRYYR